MSGLDSLAKLESVIGRLDTGLASLQESAEHIRRFDEMIKAQLNSIKMPSFEKLLLEDRALSFVHGFNRWNDEIMEGVRKWQDQVTKTFRNLNEEITEGMKRHREAHMLVSATLPERGWYLSGHEPCTLTLKLAKSVRADDWDAVDQQVIEHLPDFKPELLKQWLAEQNVPDYCINRFFLFLNHQKAGNHEEATYVGVPLIDELAKFLYGGKSFTTKRRNRGRGDQSKPELAFKTEGSPDLKNYCNDFVQTFGCLQEDPQVDFLSDENYWNRHAIVHGMMKRPMGSKDSAKCLMAINFLVFARDENDDGAS